MKRELGTGAYDIPGVQVQDIDAALEAEVEAEALLEGAGSDEQSELSAPAGAGE